MANFGFPAAILPLPITLKSRTGDPWSNYTFNYALVHVLIIFAENKPGQILTASLKVLLMTVMIYLENFEMYFQMTSLNLQNFRFNT